MTCLISLSEFSTEHAQLNPQQGTDCTANIHSHHHASKTYKHKHTHTNTRVFYLSRDRERELTDDLEVLPERHLARGPVWNCRRTLTNLSELAHLVLSSAVMLSASSCTRTASLSLGSRPNTADNSLYDPTLQITVSTADNSLYDSIQQITVSMT